jgi:hypothetical protein
VVVAGVGAFGQIDDGWMDDGPKGGRHSVVVRREQDHGLGDEKARWRWAKSVTGME